MVHHHYVLRHQHQHVVSFRLALIHRQSVLQHVLNALFLADLLWMITMMFWTIDIGMSCLPGLLDDKGTSQLWLQ